MGDYTINDFRPEVAPSEWQNTSANEGGQRYALGVATVVRVDYEKLEVTLRIETGEKFQPAPIPLTFPGAGGRHFFGSLPLPGDACVIGWGMAESGRTRVPYIISWIIPGVTAGHDWWSTQPFSTDEYGIRQKDKHTLQGIADRVRHKLRHMEPGNIVASSAQGADLVLDEGVLLTNRRGGEFRLRDQDNAIIVRSLQQFHAGAGFRVYGGMVQRDANLLPSQVVSDGKYWDQPQQVDAGGSPIPSSEFAADPTARGFLTPAGVFDSDLPWSSELDPRNFLFQGLLIDENGRLYGGRVSNAVYGGKPMYRVSTTGSNGVVDPSSDTFTEYRIEVTHTSDGTLPVTEQTDGFDADRLPSSADPSNSELEGEGFTASQGPPNTNSPFIEFVLGTVVGNQAFTAKGRDTYGVPLRPEIFNGNIRNPAMVSGVGSQIQEHAASLFRMTPPLGTASEPTFWSTTKEGRFLASIAGPSSKVSAEVSLGTGIRIGAGSLSGRSIDADLDGALSIRARSGRNEDNVGIELFADQGAIKLFAGGTTQEGGVSARNTGGEGNQPALILESATTTLIKAGNKIRFEATQVEFSNIQALALNGNASLDFQSGQGISHSSNTYALSTTGKATFNFSGPKDSLPTNGPLRETTFAPVPPMPPVFTVDKLTVQSGARSERFVAGNHSTTIVAGNQTYSSVGGLVTLSSGGIDQAAPTNLTLSPGSLVARSPVLTLTATGGAATLSSTTTTSIVGATISLVGPAVTFVSPSHLPKGPILTEGSINPITGLPFGPTALGVKTINVV